MVTLIKKYLIFLSAFLLAQCRYNILISPLLKKRQILMIIYGIICLVTYHYIHIYNIHNGANMPIHYSWHLLYILILYMFYIYLLLYILLLLY